MEADPADGSESTLTNNTVQGNRASGGGAGAAAASSSATSTRTLTDNRLAGNTAATATVGDGGGIYAVSELNIRIATIVLTGNTVQDNMACGNAVPGTALAGRQHRVMAGQGNPDRQHDPGNTAGNTAVGVTPVNNNSRGGGISWNEPFNTTLTANTVRNNLANRTGYGYGGGIEAAAQVLPAWVVVLTGNTVEENAAARADRLRRRHLHERRHDHSEQQRPCRKHGQQGQRRLRRRILCRERRSDPPRQHDREQCRQHR